MLSQVLKQVDKHPATTQKEAMKQESYRNQSEDAYFFFLLKRCYFILKDISMFKQKSNKRASSSSVKHQRELRNREENKAHNGTYVNL